MNIFFDVDYTILGADGSMRPDTEETFQKLIADGHLVYVWSGVGIRKAEVRRLGLESYVSDVFQKPIEDFEQGLVTWGVTTRPDFVIDDHPEIVRNFSGFLCSAYFWRNANDTEMRQIYRVIADVVANGSSEHEAYKPANQKQDLGE